MSETRSSESRRLVSTRPGRMIHLWICHVSRGLCFVGPPTVRYPRDGILVLCPNERNVDMATIFELISMLAMLALGFILGRIWEIRREMRRDHQIAQAGPNDTPADQVQIGYRVPTPYL
jgi:hypothetical protein